MNKYEQECQKIYTDYYVFDFDTLPLEETDNGVFTFLYYDNLLFTKDKHTKSKEIWLMVGTSDVVCLWHNSHWNYTISEEMKKITTLLYESYLFDAGISNRDTKKYIADIIEEYFKNNKRKE